MVLMGNESVRSFAVIGKESFLGRPGVLNCLPEFLSVCSNFRV